MNKKVQDKNNFHDNDYWKGRHSSVSSLEASGLQAVGLKANGYIYRMLEERYLEILERLGDKEIKSVFDCGYGDGYFLEVLSKRFPNATISGVDTSKSAYNKASALSNKYDLQVGNLVDMKILKKYDLVHCFDVLYHILDSQENYNALKNIATLSDNYVILHERFLDKVPYITSKHVRMRRSEVTNQILNSQGFYLYMEIPTHFFAMTLLTFKLNRVIPGLLYTIDRKIASSLNSNIQERLATHWIRVYKKA